MLVGVAGRRTAFCVLCAVAFFSSMRWSFAQVPVEAAADQLGLLDSDKPSLKSRKTLVYDYWRDVVERGLKEREKKYLSVEFVEQSIGSAAAPAPRNEDVPVNGHSVPS